MSYRDDGEALRAALAEAEERAREAERSRANLGQKLERAESALAVYRNAKHEPTSLPERGAWTAAALSVVAWLTPLLAALNDHDALANYLAVGAAAVALVSPFVVHAATGSLLVGGVGFALRAGFALFVTSTVTVRSAARTDSWDVLFWFGPLALLVGALVECSLLIRQARRR